MKGHAKRNTPMMTILFSPVRRDGLLEVTRAGDRLSVNGTEVDFSKLEPGARLEAARTGSDWVMGAERAADGALSVTLLLPHGPGAQDAHRFPAPRTLAGDGPVPLPDAEDAQDAEG
jgi:hypothetical protein